MEQEGVGGLKETLGEQEWGDQEQRKEDHTIQCFRLQSTEIEPHNLDNNIFKNK